MRLTQIMVASAPVVLVCACQDQDLKKFNKDPTAEIYSPEADEEVKEGAYFLASGRVHDNDDPTEQLQVTWFVNGEYQCLEKTPMADGRTECGMSIGSDDAEIILSVKDPNDGTYQASVGVVSIPAEGPTVDISEPEAGQQFTHGTKLTLKGIASDEEDPTTALHIWWWSDLDDELDIDLAVDEDGSVTGYYDQLSTGSHVLRLWAEDTSGRANSTEVMVDILPEPAPPEVEILTPEEGQETPEGTAVLFQATVSDERTVPGELLMVWSSSIDGIFNTDAPDDTGEVAFTEDGLSVGVHEISLLVTDSDDMTNAERVSITISAGSDTGTE